jgi:PAS domain S-box-containing protein
MLGPARLKGLAPTVDETQMGVTEASERWAILGPGLWSLLDDAVGALALLDAEGQIVDWNQAAEATFGWGREEAVGACAVELLVAPDLQEEFHAAFERLATSDHGRPSRHPIDLRAIHRSGREIPIELLLSKVDAGGRWLIAAFLNDVTERNRTTAGLALANARFAGAFQAASIGMALTGLDGRFLEVNPALCKLLARDADTLLASTFQDVTHPDDLAGSLEELRRARRGEIDTFQQSKRYLLPDGGFVWGLLTLTIVRDAEGSPLHFVAQIQDITARRRPKGSCGATPPSSSRFPSTIR